MSTQIIHFLEGTICAASHVVINSTCEIGSRALIPVKYAMTTGEPASHLVRENMFPVAVAANFNLQRPNLMCAL